LSAHNSKTRELAVTISDKSAKHREIKMIQFNLIKEKLKMFSMIIKASKY
jgi:hypothetical protein